MEWMHKNELRIFGDLHSAVQVLTAQHRCNFKIGGICFSLRHTARVHFTHCWPCLRRCCISVKCVMPTFCIWLLIESRISDIIADWSNRWNFFSGLNFWAFRMLFSSGTAHVNCFLRYCLAYCPVFVSNIGVTIFMGKSLVRSQLQSLSEVLAGDINRIQGRWSFTVNTKEHTVLGMNVQYFFRMSASTVGEPVKNFHSHKDFIK